MKKLFILLLFPVTCFCQSDCGFNLQSYTPYQGRHSTTSINGSGFNFVGIVDSLNTSSGLTIDGYNGLFDFTSSGVTFQNVIHVDKDNGIELLSENVITLQGPSIILSVEGVIQLNIREVGNKVVINAQWPISCLGLSTGDVYNSGGFLKVCP